MLSVLGYLLADLAVRALPSPVADRAARGVARLAFAARPRSRAALEANLARLVPQLPAAERSRCAREAFEHFALSLLDFLRLRRLPAAALEHAIEVRGGAHLERARASGRGVIVLSAHLGNWEWGAAWLAARGARVSILARPHPHPWVERWFARRRSEQGVGVLRGRPAWPAAARALRRREWVALMADRGCAGGPAWGWAAALARRTGAVVLPAVMVRLSPGRYAACFDPPLTSEACAAGDHRAALRRQLVLHPGQWFGFEPLPAGLLAGG
jgi:KDO2-lipid IV(A) lauroyltransferase